MTIPKTTKLIPLTQGKFAVVDAEDFEYLNQWKWFYFKPPHSNIGYARRTKHSGTKTIGILMHREILGNPKGIKIDHRNRNGLHNWKNNLRPSTHSENMCNQISHKGSSSKYRGVHWHKEHKKWGGIIIKNKKRYWLGYFKTEKEAALAYNDAAPKYHGEFARLNEIKP